MIEVRQARAADAPELAEVHVRSWQWGYRGLIAQDFLDAMSPDDWVDRFPSGPPDPGGYCTLVAVDGDAICGHVTVGPSRDEDLPGCGEVWAVYVDPGRWRAGIGRALFDAAGEWLGRDGYDTAFLWVLSANVRARRFYESAGWEADGRERSILIGGCPAPEVRYVASLSHRP